jgi:hypothetical protein
MDTVKASSGRRRRAALVVAVLIPAGAVYLGIGAYGVSRWMKPNRRQEMVATPAAFQLEYRDVQLPSPDAGIELSG